MDTTLNVIVEFVHEVQPEALPQQTVDEVVRRVVDSVGCGAGGFDSEPARMTRAVAHSVGGPMVASLYGVQEPVLVDFVGLANGTANRYLDFNDFGISGHPSDMIPAILGVGEAIGASGLEVVGAIYIAYEVATVLAESVPPTGGWDQGVYSSLGVAAGLSKLMGLDREKTAHALALAIVPSLPLRVTRFGELSDWKAASVPHASMTATLAARLAREGMTGPPEPFEGRYGIFEQVWEPFELKLGGVFPSAIERSSIKSFGACYWAQVALDLASQVHEEIGDPASITCLEISTTTAAHRTIGGGVGDAEQKWRPTTRETADHSMPFLVASMLQRGVIDDDSFAALQEPSRLALMDRIKVRDSAELTQRSTRDQCPTVFEVTLANGRSMVLQEDVPKGHPLRPMSNTEVANKFMTFMRSVLSIEETHELASRLWSLPDQSNLSAVGQLFRNFRAVAAN